MNAGRTKFVPERVTGSILQSPLGLINMTQSDVRVELDGVRDHQKAAEPLL